MRVTWYGTATIGIEDEKNKLLFDPFIRRNKKLEHNTPIEGFAGFDAVFITHGHFDHLYNVPELTRVDRNVPVYCTKTPAETLMKKNVPKDRISVIKSGDTVEIGNFKITAYPSKHIRFDLRYILSVFGRCVVHFPMALHLFFNHMSMPEHHEIVMYRIENGGKSILLSGSFGTVNGVDYPEDCDMFILANGGNLSIPKLTKPFIESIHPKSVFVDHFDDAFPPVTKRVCVEKFSDIMSKTHPEINFIIPTELVPFEI